MKITKTGSREFTAVMSDEEALVLNIITGKVGGDSRIRKVTERIYLTLDKIFDDLKLWTLNLCQDGSLSSFTEDNEDFIAKLEEFRNG